MKYNNNDVTAVKYTGLALDNKQYTKAPVSKIINQYNTTLWESIWRTLTTVKAVSGTTKSTTFPNCYYATGSIILEPYLVLVQLSTPAFATNSCTYIPSTGLLTYTLYSETPSTSVGSLVYCYKYFKTFEFAPNILLNTMYVDTKNSWCEIDCYIENKNSSTVYFSIEIKNSNNVVIYYKELYVNQKSTYAITALELNGLEFYITVSFYDIGFKTNSTTKYYNPY